MPDTLTTKHKNHACSDPGYASPQELRSHHKLCSPSRLPASISCRFSDYILLNQYQATLLAKIIELAELRKALQQH